MTIREITELNKKNGTTIKKTPTLKELKDEAKQLQKDGNFDEAKTDLELAKEVERINNGSPSKNTKRMLESVYNAESVANNKKKQ